MIETSIPGIDVDQLMEKVRAEIRQRQARKPLDAGSFSQGLTLDKTKSPPNHSVSNTPVLETKKFHFHMNEFLEYEDREFIIRAYDGILWRRPDSDGFGYFLAHLRSGMMTKAEILGRLRFSPEGRERKVTVAGLFWNFLCQSAFRIPVLGPVARVVIDLINLPKQTHAKKDAFQHDHGPQRETDGEQGESIDRSPLPRSKI